MESKIHSHFSMKLLDFFYTIYPGIEFKISIIFGTRNLHIPVCPTIIYFSAACIFLRSYIKIHWFCLSLLYDKFSTKIMITVRDGFVFYRLNRLQPRASDFGGGIVYAYLLNMRIKY